MISTNYLRWDLNALQVQEEVLAFLSLIHTVNVKVQIQIKQYQHLAVMIQQLLLIKHYLRKPLVLGLIVKLIEKFILKSCHLEILLYLALELILLVLIQVGKDSNILLSLSQRIQVICMINKGYLDLRHKSPGPCAYELPTTIPGNGKLTESKYKTSCCALFNPPKSSRFFSNPSLYFQHSNLIALLVLATTTNRAPSTATAFMCCLRQVAQVPQDLVGLRGNSI